MPRPSPSAPSQSIGGTPWGHVSACLALPSTKWTAIREKGIAFCDQSGEAEHRLGWTAQELFAVHPEHGTIRLDACGVLMISGEPETTDARSLVENVL